MSDIINLLPDSVANQIAAGEVIQRPASAVKELLENAVDAGARQIQLIVKDAGRTLIQVVDDGVGMSFTDSRMCFERHATSKITCADDLFCLNTKGFRGEALASIAAIAHVELKTKRAEDSTGTLLIIEGTVIKEHAPIAVQDGTSIAVKNLFFNVPARRNFLKSDSIEFGHIEEEFYRIALIHTDITFTLIHNGKTVLQLPSSHFKQRIVNIFGNHFKDKLFPVELKTDQLEIEGVIAKPENAKKKKSEQYMFINNRYVKHPLLNFAIEKAYEELIPDGYRPAYFIHLKVDPATIDVNISPTKIDVKLQDERLIFGFLNSAVKKTIGTLSLTPRLDFDYERSFDFSNLKPSDKPLSPPPVTHNTSYNPFNTVSGKSGSSATPVPGKEHVNPEGWDNFLKGLQQVTLDLPSGMNQDQKIDFNQEEEHEEIPFVMESNYIIMENRYLIFMRQRRLSMINIINARERILYDAYLDALQKQPIVIQQSLFPETIVLSSANADILNEIKEDIFKLGYDIETIGNNQFAINGTPSDGEEEEVQSIIESFIESYKSSAFLQRGNREANIALSMAKQKRSRFKPMEEKDEVNHFLQQLFLCPVHDTSPSGQKIIHYFTEESIGQIFS